MDEREMFESLSRISPTHSIRAPHGGFFFLTVRAFFSNFRRCSLSASSAESLAVIPLVWRIVESRNLGDSITNG